MNELQVKVNQQIGKISFNYDEIKQQALDMTKRYNGLVLTEDDVAPAKKDRAELNHRFDDLDTKRKNIKKTYMEPFNEFESQVKEIGKIITDASNAIDKQIKVFEDAEKVKKKAKISEIYNEIVTDIQDYIPFDKIFNSKWENIGTTMKSIKEEIQTLYDSTKMSIDTISNMHSEKVEEALKMFKVDLNLNNAISFINKFEAEKARILEQERKKQQEEAERKQREEEQRIRRENEERIRRQEREKAAEEERIRREERKRIEEEEQHQRELEAERIMKEKQIQEEKELPIEEIAPNISAEAPFEVNEQPFTSEQPFIVSKPKHVYEVIVGEDVEGSLIELLESINVTYRRLS